VDRCNAHSGKGEDYHYHGDPYGTDCLYTDADYGGTPATAHPTVIGFAFDGYIIYGRYTQAGQEGQSEALDVCGGHTHTTYGYHYHPEVASAQTTSLDGTSVSGTVTYTAYKVSPMTCWGGNIASIPNFWNAAGSQVNYDSTKDGLSGRNDLEQLKPCCGMTNYYNATGIAPCTVAGTCGTGTGTDTGTGGSDACDYGTCGSGNDNTGRQCPPDYGNGKPPCPGGCTAVPASGCSSSGTGTDTGTGGATAAPTTAAPTTAAPSSSSSATSAATKPSTSSAHSIFHHKGLLQVFEFFACVLPFL